MNDFLSELLRGVGFFVVIQEFLKKRGQKEVALSPPKGLEINAFWVMARSSLLKKEMSEINIAVNDYMSEKERVNFRLMIANAQFLSIKEDESQAEGLGTKILRGYLERFTDGTNCDICAMATQMKQDTENSSNPLVGIADGFKKFFDLGVERSQEGHEEVMKILEGLNSKSAAFAESAKEKFRKSREEFKKKHPKRKKY